MRGAEGSRKSGRGKAGSGAGKAGRGGRTAAPVASAPAPAPAPTVPSPPPAGDGSELFWEGSVDMAASGAKGAANPNGGKSMSTDLRVWATQQLRKLQPKQVGAVQGLGHCGSSLVCVCVCVCVMCGVCRNPIPLSLSSA
jgi:hypothetical protein